VVPNCLVHSFTVRCSSRFTVKTRKKYHKVHVKMSKLWF